MSQLNRRKFIITSGAACVVTSCATSAATSPQDPAGSPVEAPPPAAAALVPVVLELNGKEQRFELDVRTTLLDALREHAGLTGARKGCDHGQCGACTVHLDGRRALACLQLAVAAQGRKITTIEGLAHGEELHPMQQAFIDCDGFQCGYCTSGQIMSAVALLGEPCGPSDDDVREHMSGNLCRCGAYPGIVAAVQSVRRKV